MKAKTLFFLSAILMSFNFVNSQTINDVPISQINVQYVKIIGIQRFMTNKVHVELDFGQKNSLFSNKEVVIKDSNSNVMNFNSMIDALNFMGQNGYEYLDSYVVRDTVNYIMRKIKY